MTKWDTTEAQVIYEAPAKTHIKDRAGNPVLYKQIRELLMTDGSTRFGCVHCPELSDDPMMIVRHLKEHASRSAKAPKKTRRHKQPAAESNGHATWPASSQAVFDVIDKEIVKLTEQRDRYKQRALKAERELAKVRRALGVES